MSRLSSGVGFTIFVALLWVWLVFDFSMINLSKAGPRELPPQAKFLAAPGKSDR
jgi:hypothetical protein